MSSFFFSEGISEITDPKADFHLKKIRLKFQLYLKFFFQMKSRSYNLDNVDLN